MTDLRKQARGRGCQIRLPGICNHNSETVVLCHYRLIGISGLGMKSADLLGSWGCFDCHRVVDSNKDPEIQLAFLQGVMRTQAQLIREEIVKW